MDDTTLNALWCWDSETGKEVLVNLFTGQVIMTREDLNGQRI